MNTFIKSLAEEVDNKAEAQLLIAELVTKFGGGITFHKLEKDARFSKQSQFEVARRTAGNFLTSLNSYR